MIRVNENYAKLQASYLFAEIAHRIKAYEAEKPPRPIIRMGIGEERIKWAGKIYWRDHFYQQYWFDFLRFIHEMRRSKI